MLTSPDTATILDVTVSGDSNCKISLRCCLDHTGYVTGMIFGERARRPIYEAKK